MASMGFSLQLLFTGIGVGSIYALVALGFVLIFRATNVVNFAQGDFAMLGAFAMVVLAVDLGWPYWLSILITLAALMVFGVLFNLGVYYPLRNRSFLPVIISTIGASILIENGVLVAYGPQPQSLPGLFESQGFNISDVFFDNQYLLILAVAIALVTLQYPIFRTHADRQEAAGHLAGQGDGEPARHPGGDDDHADLRLQRGARRHRRHPGGAGALRLGRHGILDRAEGLRRQHHRRLRRRHRARSSAAWRSA